MALCSWGCSSDDERAPVVGGIDGGAEVSAEDSQADTASSDSELESGPDSSDGDAQADSGVVAPATHGDIELQFRVDATGSGADRVKQVGVASNVGTLEFAGVSQMGFAYQAHDWAGAGYELYDLVTIPEDGSDFAVTYLYCQAGALPYIYSESFTQTMAWETASGSCEAEVAPTTTTVDLPALKARPSFLATGITIDAAGLTLGTATGSAVLGGDTYELVPFNTVDCSTCPGGPWIELHSMLLREQEACFGIVYLFQDDPATIQLEHVLCIPRLERTFAVYDGTWSGTLEPALRHKLPFRPRPPAR